MQNPQQFHRRAYLPALLFVLLTLNMAPAQTVAPVPAPAGAVTSTSNQPATSQTPPAATPIKLPTIVVIAATRTPQSPDTTATTTTVITHQDLEDGLYASIPDALQSVPGLAVVTSGMPGGQTSVFIHGLESNQTLVTIDGRRQAVGLSGADDNLANLTLDDVDQIEVVRTPISSIDGGSAMGGVINIVTLTGQGLATPESSVSFEAGSFNTYRENIQSRGTVQNFDYAVSASRQDSIYPALSPGYAPFGTTGFTAQADQYRNTTYRGNFGYQITPDVYLDLHTAYSNAYTSEPNQYVTPDPTANLLIEDWNLSPGITAKVTDFYTMKAYYTHDQQRQADVDPFGTALLEYYGDSPQGEQTRLQINTDSVDWQNDFQLAHNWSITAGIQGDNRNYYEFDNVLGYDTLNGHDNNLGGYISSQWQPLPGLNILNSGRYDSYSAFGGAFSWRQAASYLIAPTKTVVHASVSSAYTPPSLQDLYLYNAGSLPFYGYGAYLPNPNLQPETDLGWEAGVSQPLWDGRITPNFTYFYNDVHNDIANVELPDENYINENVAEVVSQGFEAGLKVRPISTVFLDVDYTYTHIHVDNDITPEPLLRRPRNYFVATGTWNPVAPLTLTLGANWVIDRMDYDAISGLPTTEPDYFVLRAGATYRINDHVSIWIRGENLTDCNYQPASGYYAPSIAGDGGVKISF